MKIERRIERRFLPDMVRIFESPEVMAKKYMRLSFICVAGGALLLVIAAVMSVFAVAVEVKELLLIAGGAGVCASLFYRLSAQQIPVLIRYAAFRMEDAKATLNVAQK